MNEQQQTPTVRAAIYVRQASNSNSFRSLAVQERQCRAAAADLDWTVAEDSVFSDDGVSSLTSHRPGLEALLQKASVTPPPFDYVLVMTSSVIGRSFAVVLPIMNALERNGIGLHIADQKLDSKDPAFRALVAPLEAHGGSYRLPGVHPSA